MKRLLLSLCFVAQPVLAFSPYDVVSLIFQGIRFYHSESVPKEIVITETGIGETQQAAVQNALHIAIEKSIGVLIVSDQTSQNDKVIRNLVASYSSGVVNSYNIQQCKKDKFVSCTVTANISPWKFMRKLEGDTNTIKVNGDDLYAQAITAQATMNQRRKLTEYYFKQIRQSGLEAKIREVKILPYGNKTQLSIDYEITWNAEFKKNMIAFLEKLQKDTEGQSNQQVYIQWAPTGFFDNRVYINTHDAELRSTMLKYLFEPIEVNIAELNVCERLDPPEDVFKIDWYGFRKQKVVTVETSRLRNIDRLSLSTSCGKSS
jgi:hypothetical protein